LPLNTACKMVGLKPDEYKEDFEKYFNSLPEKTPEDQLRRFYYEYYNHYVGAGGEDRGRIHFWTVDPMWSLEFMHTIFSRIPLNWAGYKYYIQFMKALDPRLLRSPIYGSDIRLESNFSVNIYETKYRLSLLRAKLYQIIKTKIPIALSIYKSLRYRKKVRDKNKNDLLKKLQYYRNALDHTRDLFDLTAIEENLFRIVDCKRAITLFIYLGEMEKRFGNKIS